VTRWLVGLSPARMGQFRSYQFRSYRVAGLANLRLGYEADLGQDDTAHSRRLKPDFHSCVRSAGLERQH